MAKKKKEKKEVKEYKLDLSALALENDKYVGDISQFLQEKFEDFKSKREGNNLEVSVPVDVSKTKLREYLKKFLYLASLNKIYRPITLQDGSSGFKIYKKPYIE